ncbi:MAG: DedA family protein [Candidatus Gracilibacteria bacterium]|nr:DedA family protein [Candidatus Gracilibacteria bacterium]MDQ7022583.1 DedA family protein [Candidatus Gracilibacteria bacterium]
MHEIIELIKNFLGEIGYIEIFIMMTLESSFFPFPSEVAMIPAGYLSSTGQLNFSLALLVGTFGALVGATINYLLGYFLGRKIIKKLIKNYGKYFLIKERHYDKSEKYFNKHGSITTFLARFITVVRQLISLPAGVFKMNFTKFFIYTGLGAGLWNLALMTIGYIAGENKEIIDEYLLELLFGGLFIIIIIGGSYFYIRKKYYGEK